MRGFIVRVHVGLVIRVFFSSDFYTSSTALTQPSISQLFWTRKSTQYGFLGGFLPCFQSLCERERERGEGGGLTVIWAYRPQITFPPAVTMPSSLYEVLDKWDIQSF